ncbi:MAG TPA: glycosyltransferase family 2 protein [Flavisolibacter sp.]|nr:glycosyltransferase family 2 protein [Flavisolibacter sp.]
MQMNGEDNAIRLPKTKIARHHEPEDGVEQNRPGSRRRKGPGHIKVSAVLICFNEAARIGKTLSQLWWCDEIIVIDSGSSDATVPICREFGCKVFTHPFTGFGEQKKYGVSKAANDWILCPDADEVLTDELIEEIRNELNQPKVEFGAFMVPRNLVFMNKTFAYGKETGSYVVRLFNKKLGNWDGAVVHETVVVDGPVKKLRNKILHYSYQDYGQFMNKINLYSTLAARKLLQRGSRKSRLMVILAIPFNFFRYYVLDRNFLNGYRGFAWAVLNTCYHFVKYLKLEELRSKSPGK